MRGPGGGMKNQRNPIARALGVPDDLIIMPGELTPENVVERQARFEIALSAWILRVQQEHEAKEERRPRPDAT
jgi:hypothetical protein